MAPPVRPCSVTIKVSENPHTWMSCPNTAEAKLLRINGELAWSSDVCSAHAEYIHLLTSDPSLLSHFRTMTVAYDELYKGPLHQPGAA